MDFKPKFILQYEDGLTIDRVHNGLQMVQQVAKDKVDKVESDKVENAMSWLHTMTLDLPIHSLVSH